MDENAPLHGDVSERVVVDTNAMDWVPSPSGGVLRKRLHRVGPAEAGQVTSIVQYRPGSSFPTHPHPEGEEIFVLEGVFSDALGDAGPGMHLLNPEGFEHAPWSQPGCTIFVKLRQYPGTDRAHRRTDTNAMEWLPTGTAGIRTKPLDVEEGRDETTHLEHWETGAQADESLPGGAELLVTLGELADEHGPYPAGTWLRLPPGSTWTAEARAPSQVYVKRGALPALRQG